MRTLGSLIVTLILGAPAAAVAGGGDDAGAAADAGPVPDAAVPAPDAGGRDSGLPAPADDDGCSAAGASAGLAPILAGLAVIARRRRRV